MNKYLLDTNICVFLLRGKKYQYIQKKLEEIGVEACSISEITYAELLYGAFCSVDNSNIEKVKNFCSKIEILPISPCLENFSEEKARLRDKGLMIDDFDLLIGSTAKVFNLILITDNVKHFDRLSVKIENWVKR